VSGRGERQLKGLQLRWREAGDTEGEVEGWRNIQQGYGSFRQIQMQLFGKGAYVTTNHTVGAPPGLETYLAQGRVQRLAAATSGPRSAPEDEVDRAAEAQACP